MNNLSAEYLRYRLRYYPETGVFIWRRKKGNSRTINWWNSRYAGTRAGTPDQHGYLKIYIDTRGYKAHRLAWLHFYGEHPHGCIDHVDRDPSNNRISNLRLASRAQNQCNMSRPKSNTSGYKGVSWFAANQKWMAKIQHRGSQIYLGYYSTPEEAYAAYVKKARELFGEFYAEGAR